MFFSFVAVVLLAGCGSVHPSNNNTDNVNTKKTAESKAFTKISGTILFTGLAPDPGDTGVITIFMRKHGTDDLFTPVKLSTKPTLVNNSPWVWDKAVSGIVYDVQANLKVNNKEVAISEIKSASAPASDVELPLQVTWSNLPLEGREKSFQKIGGDIKVSGYVPEGSKVTIYTAKARDNSELQPEEVDNPIFTAVVKNVSITNNKKWYWDEALGKIDYLVKSELFAPNGDKIGISDIIRATAPNEDTVMNITSTTSAPVPVENVALSGTVHLDGSYKKDSKIIVSVRANGVGGFDEVASFSAESDREWEWTKAKGGIEYDVRATLMQKGEEIAKSSQKHTYAPAENIKLKIDTGMDLDDPTEKPYLIECKKRDGKKYDAKITFPGIGDARAYWVKVGTSKHSGNRFNEAEKPDNTGDDLTIKMRVDKNKDYYAEYAYSYCRDCETLDSFSDFSPHVKFSCPEE